MGADRDIVRNAVQALELLKTDLIDFVEDVERW
jgi:hypothetical protein